jgi:hypothetical protein
MGDARAEIAEHIFLSLVGDSPTMTLVDEEEVRSAPYSDSVDVKFGEQWYRISATPIDEPISLKAHRNEADDGD